MLFSFTVPGCNYILHSFRLLPTAKGVEPFIITLVYLILKHRHSIATLLPLFCLVLYGGLTAASIAVSRLGFGLLSSLSSRYISLANLFLFTVIILLFKTIELTAHTRNPMARYLSAFALLAVASLSLVNYHQGFLKMHYESVRFAEGRQCALLVNNPNDSCLAKFYLHRDKAFLGIQYLHRVHGAGL